MAQVFDRVKVATATTGTGNLTLGAAESGYRTFAQAGAADGTTVNYIIEDGTNWEIGTGQLGGGGSILSRNVVSSSNGNAAISLSGNARVFSGLTKADIDGKSNVGHQHSVADVVGLQAALDGKQPAGSYVTSAGFTWANLGGKPSTFAPSAHRHSWADLDGVPSSFTPSAHGHAIGDIAGLQAALDAKQAAGSYLPTTGGTLTGALTINDPYLGVLTLRGQSSGQTEYQVRQGVIGGSVGGFSIYEVATGQNRIAIRPDGVVFINGRDVLGEMDSKSWLAIPDTRDANASPTDLAGHAVRFDFKRASVVGNPPVAAAQQPSYAHIMSVTGWNGYEPSGGLPAQLSFGDGLAIRAATSPTAWGPWRTVWHNGNLPNPLRMGEGGRPFSYDNGGGAAYIQGDAGGWSVGYKIKDSSGANRGGFGALGGGTTLTHYWIGADYDAAGALRLLPTGELSLGGNVTLRGLRNQIVGQYDPANTQGIWAMGEAYTLAGGAAFSGNYGNHYGLAWSYNPDYGGAGNNPQSKPGLGHQMLLQWAGVTKTAIGDGIWTNGNIYANGNNVQPLRPNRLYRRDDTNSDYSVQHHWTGTHWWLRGYAGDEFHAECRVGYADSAGNVQGYGIAVDGTGNSIALRNSSGYLFATYLNQSSGNNENPIPSQIIVTNGSDSYFRKASIAHVASYVAMQSAVVSGLWQFDSNGMSTANSANPPLQAYASSSGAAMMSFHRSGAYAVNMGLDADNVFRIGGWSAAANRLQLDMSGNLTVAGDVTAFSDARLKTNIRTIEGALDIVDQLRGVRFEKDGKENLGVVAQEVQEVLPELVHESNDGTLAVALPNLVGVLIEAVKELRAENRQLKEALGL